VVTGGVLVWPLFRRLSLRLRLVALCGVLAIVPIVAFSVPSVRSRIDRTFASGTFDFQTGPQARITAWGLGLRWSRESFPAGWGIGAIEEHPNDFGGHATAENVYLQYLAQLGVVGFVALVVMSVQGLRFGMRSAKARPGDGPALYATAFFAALIVHGMFGNTLGDPTIQVLLACALGFCIAPGTMRDVGSRSAPADVRTSGAST
jgi:O-antigen ligase